MAKINIQFDTESKAVSATMDGKSLENIDSISLYNKSMMYTMDGSDDKKEYILSICMCDKSSYEEDGYKTHTIITAKDNDLAKESEQYKGFFEYRTDRLSDVQNEIVKTMIQRKK